jgi:hypothetical protein
MRALLKVSAILVPTLFLSTAAGAQTGEFAAAVPGEVVHGGYALQDEWQRLRNATASPPASTPQKSRPSRTESQEATRRHNN